MTLEEAISHIEKLSMRAGAYIDEAPVVLLSVVLDTLKQLKEEK